MKLKTILNSILTEAKMVGTVYHFASLRAAIGILNDNLLKSSIQHSSMQFIQKRYGNNFKSALSTTRDKNFENSRIKKYYPNSINSASIGGIDIIFVIDGNKLSNTYKTVAYDDFSSQKRIGVLDYHPSNDEMEQVWFGTKIDSAGGISNFTKYIEKIIISDEYTNRSNVDKELLKVLIDLATQEGIKYEFEDPSYQLS